MKFDKSKFKKQSIEDVEAEDGTITVYTEPTDLHKALEALRANGQEEFQVTELEMIPQTEVTLEGEDLETFKGLIDALEADDEVLVKRILERGKTSGRPDDQDEAKIRNRYDEYNQKTAPLMDFYKAQDKFHAVNGIGTIQEVTERLEAVINSL